MAATGVRSLSKQLWVSPGIPKLILQEGNFLYFLSFPFLSLPSSPPPILPVLSYNLETNI